MKIKAGFAELDIGDVEEFCGEHDKQGRMLKTGGRAVLDPNPTIPLNLHWNGPERHHPEDIEIFLSEKQARRLATELLRQADLMRDNPRGTRTTPQ